jgi:hypothetical protein
MHPVARTPTSTSGGIGLRGLAAAWRALRGVSLRLEGDVLVVGLPRSVRLEGVGEVSTGDLEVRSDGVLLVRAERAVLVNTDILEGESLGDAADRVALENEAAAAYSATTITLQPEEPWPRARTIGSIGRSGG